MAIKPLPAFIIFVLIVAIPLFAHLDTLPLAEWDESHLAGNAIEMKHNHNWIVTMCNGAPEMWQTKPPLMIWMQVIAMNIFGENELAIRLPAALAALGVCLLLFFFFTKKYNEPFLALVAIAVLITSDGFMHQHAARNGEYDMPLTLFMTAYVFFYFLYLEDGKRKYIYATFAMLILAALTKGIQSLLFVPGLFIYTLYKKKVITVLKQKELYIGIACFILFVIGYYTLRDHYNPGYIAAVRQNELGARYNAVIEDHASYPTIYYDWLKTLFSFWYLWVLPGVLYGLFSSKKWLRDFTVFTSIVTAIYFLVLSSASTAVFWYALPAYPFLAIFAALFICTIFSALRDAVASQGNFPASALPFVFLMVIFFRPFVTTIDTIFAPPHGSGESAYIRNMELLMKDVLHNKINIDNYTIADHEHEQHIGWYFKAYEYQHKPIMHKHENDLDPTSKVIAFRPESRKFIEEHYNARVIDSYYTHVVAYQLDGRK